MRRQFRLSEFLLVVLLALAGCSQSAGKPAPGPEVPRPDSVLNPVVLYNANCAGCHGADGKSGPAMMLSDPVYLTIVDDDTLRIDHLQRPYPAPRCPPSRRRKAVC